MRISDWSSDVCSADLAGQDPASSTEEASLDIDKFDASIRDALTGFFAKVLHRNYKKRFDNAAEMYLAWKRVFKHIDPTTLDETAEERTAQVAIGRAHV